MEKFLSKLKAEYVIDMSLKLLNLLSSTTGMFRSLAEVKTLAFPFFISLLCYLALLSHLCLVVSFHSEDKANILYEVRVVSALLSCSIQT